jgi:hypothetical protein
MKTENRLGIIVNSNRYFDFVEKLAEAALGQEKQVRIHLLGSGCEFIDTHACMRLSRQVQLTLCPSTPQQNLGKPDDHYPCGVVVVPPRELSAVFQDCSRIVVF